MRHYTLYPIESYLVFTYKCPECGHEYIKTEKQIEMFDTDICWCGASLHLQYFTLKKESVINKEKKLVENKIENKVENKIVIKPPVLNQKPIKNSSLIRDKHVLSEKELVDFYVSGLKQLGYRKSVALHLIKNLRDKGEDFTNRQEFFDKLIRNI